MIDSKKNSLDLNAKKIASLLLNAKYPICLTGAGISTRSGIPDFRSPKTGLWNQEDAKKLVAPGIFEKVKYDIDQIGDVFWKVGYRIGKKLIKARPNINHLILANWENKLGLIKAIITQNIDDLHQRAGSKNVIELHGNAFGATCTFCRSHYKLKDLLKSYKKSGGKAPWCTTCGAPIRPNVVLFFENLPKDAVDRALKEIKRADFMLILGSSLMVYPANYLPVIVHKRGGKIAIINDMKTDLDPISEVNIHCSIASALKKIDYYIKKLNKKLVQS
ncbi:MAG: NAD-dependent protein deacylase [Promethearchaeota archaeon]